MSCSYTQKTFEKLYYHYLATVNNAGFAKYKHASGQMLPLFFSCFISNEII